MKTIIAYISLVLSFTGIGILAKAQYSDTTYAYYNAQLIETSSDAPDVYYKEIIFPNNNLWLYQQTSIKDNRMISKGQFSISAQNMRIRTGTWMNYFPDGKIERMSTYGNKGNIIEIKEYRSDNTLQYHILFDSTGKVISAKGWTPEGDTIKNFVYQKDAYMDFSWKRFLLNNLDQNVPLKNGAPPGYYTVRIRFSIDTDGKVNNVSVIKDAGYGTGTEAARVIASSPQWQPALQYNKPVSTVKVQSLTFYVSGSNKQLKKQQLQKKVIEGLSDHMEQ